MFCFSISPILGGNTMVYPVKGATTGKVQSWLDWPENFSRASSSMTG